MRIDGAWLTNTHTQAVCAALKNAGHQALFVGGCVRNALLDVPVSDIDIATDAEPETVTRIEKEAGFKVVPTGIDHGTVTVIADGVPHEVTTFRHDVETDGRKAVVAFSAELEEDARRRDFTMNALYARPDGTVVDPLGGLPDLLARHVRFIEDPAQRIREDYLRILRFFRFYAYYGDPEGGLDPEGLAAVAAHLDGLARLSRERVGAEMVKLLAAPDPAPSIASMRQSGVLNAVLPGADDRALGLLIHLERAHGVAPDATRRLACLGGERVAERFRLSRRMAARLERLRDAIGSGEGPAGLGYRLGFEDARDACLLRAASLETDLTPEDLLAAHAGAEAVFPVVAADLMPRYEGARLGRRMKQLEAAWIDSAFRLTREALIALPDGPE